MTSRKGRVARAGWKRTTVAWTVLTSLVMQPIAISFAHAADAEEGRHARQAATLEAIREEEKKAVDQSEPVKSKLGPSTAARISDDARTALQERERVPENLAVSALPTSGMKPAVVTPTLSLPQGAGKVRGMGESFSAELSTGIATYRIPFELPNARGAAQPTLGLTYSSSGGHGVAGVGWGVGAATISRQLDRALPRYQDPPLGGGWTPDQDRFVFGSTELVPICLVDGTACAGALAGEDMPDWASGWQYFRPRVEGSFQRFFWSPNHRTWRVQDKSGVSMEFGVPLSDSNALDGLEVDPGVPCTSETPCKIFSWHLVRQYDTVLNSESGAPVNAVLYRYLSTDGISYLTDIYDTSRTSAATSSALSAFAHHTRLAYEPRPDVTTSFRRGWPVRNALRLKHVDVTSHDFAGTSSSRQLVRRYNLTYEGLPHVSLLQNVQLEGRCAVPVSEDSSGALPDLTGCPTLPAMKFDYHHIAGYGVNGQTQVSNLPGFEAFDERVQASAASPPHSLDETLTELFDIDADSLPDVLVTDPARYNGGHAVFFNGAGQLAQFASWLPMSISGGETANVLKLSNPNVSSHDLDGDGIANLLHMPMVNTYWVYSPAYLSDHWAWQGRSVTAQQPKIDFAHRSQDLRTMDVDADGLVDVVYSTGTEYQTFFSLGRYANGDGKFGSATWATATSANISNEPVAKCIPWDGIPIRFSDPDVHVADLNGDGFPDVLRVRPGDIRYWPGRGNGYWGTGDPSTCPAGTFGQEQDVVMSNSPEFGIPGDDPILLNDVNGDGMADLVRVHHQAVSIYLNIDGVSWTGRHVIDNSPPNGTVTNRVRVTDINGSGTPDILWGDAFAYKYIDLAGGKRPWLLLKASNGLGRTTEFDYSTSAEQMLAAKAAGHEWSSKAPTVMHMVSRITDRDHLDVVGRPGGAYVTEYTYRNPVYDGRQREFRGFETVSAKTIGDANSPTSITKSTFLLGECRNEAADVCAPQNRWQDNPKEALKGLPVLTEVSDGAESTYLSTEHTTYRLRTLYAGLDGRLVRQVFASATDTYRYDTAPFSPSASDISLTDVEVEDGSGNVQVDLVRSVRRQSGLDKRARLRHETTVDRFGNVTAQVDKGCTQDCSQLDESITSRTDYARPASGLLEEPSGWLFRAEHQWIEGANAERRHEVRHHYLLNGLLESSEAFIAGTLGLDRFHQTAAADIAPPPATAASDGWYTVVQYTYDDYGNVTYEEQPGAIRHSTDYDGPYAELVTAESVGTGAIEPYFPQYYLLQEAEYDRGLQSLTQLTDNHWAYSGVTYDGFGRPTAIYKPDPVSYDVSSWPSVKIEYSLPADATTSPYSLVHVQVQDGTTVAAETYSEAWSYVDGLGRVIVTLEEADTSAGDLGSWIAKDFVDYDLKGAKSRAYLSFFYSGDPSAFPLGQPITTPSTRQRYDAFGRGVETLALDGAMTSRTMYHALSADAWDAADLEPGPHAGTPTTTRSDGHGRTVSVVTRIHRGSQLEEHETKTTYLASGEPSVITRSGGGLADVVRWFRYDSQGRMVLNVDPDTTQNFNASPQTDPSTMRAWRYAYDIYGKLVGTSDPRGCGVNYQYLIDGRLAGEDYSPCLDAQPVYSSPDFSTGDGAEVFNLYDLPDPDGSNIPGFDYPPPNRYDPFGPLWGRLVSTSDRGQKSIFRYDGRGRLTGVAKRVAKPGDPLPAVADRYAPHWYVQTTAYDAEDRPTQQTTGADVPELLGANGASYVSTAYSQRGVVTQVGSSYSGILDNGALVSGISRDADGLIQQITYGDVARTSTHFQYDLRRRIASVQTDRGPPSLWSASPAAYTPAPPSPTNPPSTLQLVLEDSSFTYDSADNPVELRDWRNPLDWPTGAMPVTRKATYDDFYRLSRLDYLYANGDDDWTSPFAAENAGGGPGPKPSPHVSFGKRILWESFAYDALGNTVATDDDAHGFYDRSLGTVSNGSASSGPYQLRAAANAPNQTRSGALDAVYDDAGNLVSLAVGRDGPCLGSTCSQRFVYDWDESGRLARGRRWDVSAAGSASDPLPTSAPAADLRYAYDGDNNRTLKTAVSAVGDAYHSVYIFGSLELRHATWVDDDFERTSTTEKGCLFANGVRLARLHYAANDVPTLSSGQLHVLFVLPDYLGSSSFVVDAATSELVEAARYRAFGGADSDYRPERWKAYRDDYRFTGKEEDIEVGISYFGQRYLSPHLNRWLAADPLALHDVLDGDLNLYSYVRGRVLISVDPVGLDGTSSAPWAAASGWAQKTWQNSLLKANIDQASSYVQDRASYWSSHPSEYARGFLDKAELTALAGLATSLGGPGAGTAVAGGGEVVVARTLARAVAAAGALAISAPALQASRASGGGKTLEHGRRGKSTYSDGATVKSSPSAKAPTSDVGQPGGPKSGSSGGPGAGKRFSESTREAARAETAGKCVFCKEPTTRQAGPKQGQTDHAVPKSRGGNDTLENAQHTCRTCNLGKGAKTTDEYLSSSRIKSDAHNAGAGTGADPEPAPPPPSEPPADASDEIGEH